MAAVRPIAASLELILVEDRGNDGSWDIIRDLARTDPRVRGFRLSRNFGQHMAITAGLEQSRGRWVMVMDCDLQDPPELIPEFHRKAMEGYDLVLGRRTSRRQSPLRRHAAVLYFRLLSRLCGRRMSGDYGTFSILARPVVDAFLRFGDRDRQYIFILLWLGFQSAEVAYEPAERANGRSSYTIGKLIRHALNGLFFQTTVLLSWILYLGMLVAALGFATALYFLYRYFSGSMLPGWTSLIVVMLVLGGAILMSVGAVGLFVARIFEQVKSRPLYIVADTTSPRALPGDEPLPQLAALRRSST
jgi:dolichol-phosphate mannosyltransferase